MTCIKTRYVKTKNLFVVYVEAPVYNLIKCIIASGPYSGKTLSHGLLHSTKYIGLPRTEIIHEFTFISAPSFFYCICIFVSHYQSCQSGIHHNKSLHHIQTTLKP
jgi:hypothetical protein